MNNLLALACGHKNRQIGTLCSLDSKRFHRAARLSPASNEYTNVSDDYVALHCLKVRCLKGEAPQGRWRAGLCPDGNLSPKLPESSWVEPL